MKAPAPQPATSADRSLDALRAAVARLRARGLAVSAPPFLESEEAPAARPEPPPVRRHWLDELEDRLDQERDQDLEGAEQ